MSEFQMHATDKPGVWLIESETHRGTEYIVRGVGTPFLICSCPASQLHGGECKHSIFVLERMIEELKGMETDTARIEQAEQVVTSGRDLMVTQRNGSLVRADQYERGLLLRGTAAALAGAFMELVPLAQAMVDAKLVPAGMNVPAAALLMQRALEIGMPPMTAFELLFVVDGKVKIQGQGIQALIQRDGRGRIEIDPESNAEWCRATGKRPGYSDLEITWTIEQAKKAGLMSHLGWSKYPEDMLRWKCIARIGRLMFADLLGAMDVVDPGGQSLDVSVLEDSPANRLEVPDVANGTYEVRGEQITGQTNAKPGNWLPEWTRVRKETGVTKEQLAAYFGTETVGTKQVQSKLDEGMSLADICKDAITAWVSAHTEPEVAEGDFTEVELPFQ